MAAKKIKTYVFGYGSLVSREDLRRTLKRPISEIHNATLNGWSRSWSIVLENASSLERYAFVEDGFVPKYVAVLNVEKPLDGAKPTNPNGVLFEVFAEDLELLDARESHYARTDVTDDIIADINGKVYTYVGLPQYMTADKHMDEVILASSYQDIVKTGFDSIGDLDAVLFGQTTIVSDLKPHLTVYVTT